MGVTKTEEAKNIDSLVGRTIILESDSCIPGSPEYYQGKLERYVVGHRIWEPLEVYPDGTKKKKKRFVTVRQSDLDKGRIEIIQEDY
jgi:hypothetical protein